MPKQSIEEKRVKKSPRVDAIVINDAWCKGCELCVDVCPRPGVFAVSDEMNSKGYRRILIADLSLCTGCGLCELMCPDIAITIKKI
jgi:2-oxoglutarate ferredoxin oxidoreductase subunit delta